MDTQIKDNIPNAMFMNGPKAGDIIKLPSPTPDKVTVATMVNMCKHRPEDSNPMLMVEYKIYKPVNELLPYQLITEDKTIANAYYCMQCKAEAEVKYQLKEIKDLLDEALDEEDED